jgi:putative transposase
MKQPRLTEIQIIGIFKGQEGGTPAAEVCHRHGISSATFCKYRARFGGVGVSVAQRLKVLDDENSKLKKLQAEAMLDIAILKQPAIETPLVRAQRRAPQKMVAPDAKREAAAHVVAAHGVSQRRACEVLAVDRSGVRYRSIRPDDAAERAAMKAVSAARRRFGHRSIRIMLERQGIMMNLKKLRRLAGEERRQVRKRGGRKTALETRRAMVLPGVANER